MPIVVGPPQPPEKYRAWIEGAADRYQMPRQLLAAVLWVESAFRDEIVTGAKRSPAGAVGIAQFMPGTAADLGIDPTDAHASIYAAARYLAQMHFLFGDWRSAVAAYNWGPGNLARHGLDAAPEETRTYLARVQAYL